MSRRASNRPSLAVLAHRRPWLASVGKCKGCGGPLIDVARKGVHPDPECDPDNPDWWMTPEDLAELAALYPETPAQEAKLA